MSKKVLNYFSKHVMFNSTIHFIGGVGVGILLTYPLVGQHPLRWGISFIILAILGHLFALQSKR